MRDDPIGECSKILQVKTTSIALRNREPTGNSGRFRSGFGPSGIIFGIPSKQVVPKAIASTVEAPKSYLEEQNRPGYFEE